MGVKADPDSYYARVRHYSAERIGPFNSANRGCPKARETERRLLIDRLDLQAGLVILDTGSGGGYLVDGFPAEIIETGTVICSDTAEHFIRSIPPPFIPLVCGMDAFGLADCSVDRVANLAGLHHIQHKAAVFAEAWRVLKPGGLVAVADVKRDTRPAAWLNGPVDRMTDIGHDGMFVEEGDFSTLLRGAGFEEIAETHEVYAWDFCDRQEMVSFVRDLFRLTHASLADIESVLPQFLDISERDGSIALGWELTYATGRKRR